MNFRLVCLLTIAHTSISGAEVPSFVRDHHRTSLLNFIKMHPHYVVADDAYCKCPKDLNKARFGSKYFDNPSPNFHPYYAVGDANDDGREDFVIGLVNREVTAPKYMSVVVFHGPFRAARPKRGIVLAEYFTPFNTPPDVPNFIHVAAPKVENKLRYPARIMLGPIASDDLTIYTYNWKIRKYVGRYALDGS
jgi:hypothetical protein